MPSRVPGTPRIGHVLLLGVPLLAWLLDQAGWPREQVFAAAIFAATALLWATELLPLFVTAFLSIAAQMFLLANPAGWDRLGFDARGGPPPEAFLHAAADPVLVLFFGGLVLARAIARTGVDRRLAALILRPMASSPATMLLGVMLTTSCFSLLMSNTATTTLMLALVVPILSQLPPGDPFRKALLLAVPIAANIAGMGTPIASPPNAIAVSYLARDGVRVGFLEWMAIALPIVAILLAAAWWWLLRSYRPAGAAAWRLEFDDAPLAPSGAWVAVVVLLTLTVWMTEPWHGVPADVAAVLPVILLFGTNIVGRTDVNTLEWDVLILIAGGLTLGYTLQVTGVDARLAALIPDGASGLTRLTLLALATFTLGTFFSNTAIASMLMPIATIAAAAGLAPTGLALAIALTASVSMALPVSTPPNALAHATGELTRGDFLRTTGLIGFAGTLLVIAIFAVLDLSLGP